MATLATPMNSRVGTPVTSSSHPTVAGRRNVTVWSLISSIRSVFARKPMAYSNKRWWDASTVAVVTGSNKGIGFEIARELSKQGLTTVMTARNPDLGTKATAQVAAIEGAGKVVFHPLDISQPASVEEFAAWLKEEFPAGIDILVNNAGFAYKGDTFGAEEADVTLGINFYGTMDITESLKPLLKDGTGRVVNVSSRAGKTNIIPDANLLNTITSASSKEELRDLAAKFVKGIETGTFQQEGWPKSMYGVSKLLLSMYTRVVAMELQQRNIMVNACCPGWCQTDMSSGRGPNTALQGADTPLWLALRSPEDFATGKLFAERSDIPF